jgi:hypothetical protein
MRTFAAQHLAAASVAIFLSSLVNAQPITTSPPGTKFTFSSTDRWKKETDKWDVEVIERTGDVTGVRHTGMKETVNYKIASDGLITRPKPLSSETWTYKPVPFPLGANTEWEWQFFYIAAAQQILSVVVRQCKADGMEEISVPAGRFNTIKYECKGSWQSGSFSGVSRRKGWFSPELNVSVLTEDQTSGGYGTDLSVTQLQSVSRP